jgi:3-phosphoshikimate 1-carboxyvinyltransferase
VTTITVEGGTGPLRGRLRVPGDKSISHRALILAALAEGTSAIRGLSTGYDVLCTAAALRAMGADINGVSVAGGRSRLHEPETVLDVGNSGTAIRLLAGLCSGLPWLTVLQGDESIAQRPMDRVVGPLRSMGAHIDGRDDGRFAPLVIRGGEVKGVDHTLAVPSAQVKGALLLAGLSAEGPTTVRGDVPIRAHTEELLALAGADVRSEPPHLVSTVHPSELRPFDLDVPGDPSQAAFWVVAACVVPGSEVTVEHVYVGQARAVFLDVLLRMGADIHVESTGEHTANITARHGPRLQGTMVGGDEIPGLIDEVPVLAVAAAVAEGPTGFTDAAELRVKETDRIATVVALLDALGAWSEPRPDGLHVAGGAPLSAGQVDSFGDHRVAMAGAVAALVAPGPTRITGWDAVGTSYPGFEDDLRHLLGGGR